MYIPEKKKKKRKGILFVETHFQRAPPPPQKKILNGAQFGRLVSWSRRGIFNSSRSACVLYIVGTSKVWSDKNFVFCRVFLYKQIQLCLVTVILVDIIIHTRASRLCMNTRSVPSLLLIATGYNSFFSYFLFTSYLPHGGVFPCLYC